MNEDELASTLSAQIDAILSRQPAPLEGDFEELKPLLALAEQLAALDLPPRPAFGQQLKKSLLDRGPGGSSGGRLAGIPYWLILGLVAVLSLVGMGVIAVILAVTVVLPQDNLSPTPTAPAPAPTATPTPTCTPVLATLTPCAPATTTQIDTILTQPASATDMLAPQATASAPLLREGDQPSDDTPGGDSNRDSEDDGDDDCDQCDDD